MGRFDQLQAQVENLEARVRSYEVGGPSISVWGNTAEAAKDPLIEKELEQLKERVFGTPEPDRAETAVTPEPARAEHSAEPLAED
jgi:hypothetical protein